MTNNSNYKFLLIGLIVLLVIFIGLVFLQIFLSKRRKKFLGIILPAVSLLLSFPITLVCLVLNYSGGFLPGSFISTLMIFVMINVPTLVFTFIYLGLSSRRRYRRTK